MKHGLKNQALVLDFGSAEVYEEANFDTRRFYLVQQLRFVALVIWGGDFEFDDDASVYQ